MRSFKKKSERVIELASGASLCAIPKADRRSKHAWVCQRKPRVTSATFLLRTPRFCKTMLDLAFTKYEPLT